MNGPSQVVQVSRATEICHFPVLPACAVAEAHVSGTLPEQYRGPKGLCVFCVQEAAQRFCSHSGTLSGSPGQQGRVSQSWLQTRMSSYPTDSMVQFIFVDQSKPLAEGCTSLGANVSAAKSGPLCGWILGGVKEWYPQCKHRSLSHGSGLG